MKRAAGTLRIVGGQWRSRLVRFDAANGVRPTPDRVRQTLFDWLSPRIAGAVCLDLFAGSGALGLEALSRGARKVRFVEQGAAQCRDLREALRVLGTAHDDAQVDHAEALDWVERAASAAERYEIVFLDPPYAAGLLAPALQALVPLLRADNRVYLEWPGAAAPDLPPGYARVRDKQAGGVSFCLVSYTPSGG